MTTLLREHAEQQYAEELDALAQADTKAAPAELEALAVGRGDLPAGRHAGRRLRRQPKYIGNRRLIEIAVATLATDRALLLLGVPGTAKTWVSEHLAAAITGDSTLLVQGTAGTGEEAIRYGWNYARLLAEGPSRERPGRPARVMRAMRDGKIARVEELTRIPADVQDTLITILSEKTLPIPELNAEVQADARASTSSPPPTTATGASTSCRARSSAASTRSSCRVPDTADEEVEIVQRRVDEPRPRPRTAGRAARAGGDPPHRDRSSASCATA